MNTRSVGFIGGGRITRIMLTGFRKSGCLPEKILVTDSKPEVLSHLEEKLPEVKYIHNDYREVATQDLVFLAIHPPMFAEILPAIREVLGVNTILVSLAPKITIPQMVEMLGGFNRITRMIPNAPSIIGSGYNPLAFAPSISSTERQDLVEFFSAIGICPIVEEETLEAYAIVTAMGPTYLWFQLYELYNLGRAFGLSENALLEGIPKMMIGAIETLFHSGLTPDEVMDLIPVKPLAEGESMIKELYRSNLKTLYEKLHGPLPAGVPT